MLKCPLNYVGGKTKLLPQILPLFPKHIHTFVDLFGGGFNVGINVEADQHIYNEVVPQITSLMKLFYEKDFEYINNFLTEKINEYGLSKENKEGYLQIRNLYNEQRTSELLFLVICYAFNNQIRFNKNGEYNMPFGKDRSQYTNNMKKNLELFCNEIKNKDVYFYSDDFRVLLDKIESNEEFYYDNEEMPLLLDGLGSFDFVYADPQYLISNAAYNEKSTNGGWGIQEENDLLNWLDKLSKKGVRWALSNVLENNGYSNDLLKKWSEQYNVYHLNHTYGNCNYHRTNKVNDSDEVLITNYLGEN